MNDSTSTRDTGADSPLSLCLVVPHFNHAKALQRSLPSLLATGHPVIVVDDGSTTSERLSLERTVHEYRVAGASLTLETLAVNVGKGAAVLHGCSIAKTRGHTHVLQIDADGQHDPDDLPRLLELAAASPQSIVSGKPVFDDDAPTARVHGRKLTTLMIAIETLGGGIEDGLCGYRIYPVEVVERLQRHFRIAPRMGFDTDMLVKARWLDVPVRFVPTRVRYPVGGRSHFHYLRDNLGLIRLHLGLLAGAAWRVPGLLARRLRRSRSVHPDRFDDRSDR